MECIVPFPVEGMPGEVDRSHLGGIGLLAGLIRRLVALGLHFQPRVRRGGGDECDHHFVADQGLASPILGDVAEKPMLDLVPFTGGWGKMTYGDLQSELATQLRQTPFPQMTPSAVAAPAVGGNEQPRRAWVAATTHFAPPATNTLHGKFGGVMIAADTDPAFVAPEIVDPIRDGFAQFLVDEIIDFDFLGLPFGAPPLAAVFIHSHEFLLLRIDTDHRLLPVLKGFHLVVDMAELGIAVFMAAAFVALAVGLQAVTEFGEQLGDLDWTDAMAGAGQFGREPAHTFASPTQGTHRITAT